MNFHCRTLFHFDNLLFLRGEDFGRIDFIAIDHPFNKGKNFHVTPEWLSAGASFQADSHDREIGISACSSILMVILTQGQVMKSLGIVRETSGDIDWYKKEMDRKGLVITMKSDWENERKAL